MNKITEHYFTKYYKIASGISSKPKQAGHGFPFVSFSTVFNNYFLPTTIPDLMDTSEQERETYSVKEGDVFLTRTSETFDELAMSCVALKDYSDTTFSGFVKRLRPKQEAKGVIYAKYLGFYLRSYLFRKTITNHSIQTLRASFNEDIFSFLKLYLPDYEQQVKIGDFLYLLEKKITLNNLLNIELDNVARTLYDYWFTQFDFPDDNGNPYKTSGGAMKWNEKLKQKVPAKWEVKSLGDFLDITRGSIITEKTTEPGEIKVVAAGVTFSYLHSTPNRPCNTITVSSSGANAGYLNFWHEEIYASDCITVRGKTDIDTILAYKFLQRMQGVLMGKSIGSAQPHVYPSDIATMLICEIPQRLKDKITPIMLNINTQIAINKRENEELTTLRDFLLPLLTNGQVTLSASKD